MVRPPAKNRPKPRPSVSIRFLAALVSPRASWPEPCRTRPGTTATAVGSARERRGGDAGTESVDLGGSGSASGVAEARLAWSVRARPSRAIGRCMAGSEANGDVEADAFERWVEATDAADAA